MEAGSVVWERISEVMRYVEADSVACFAEKTGVSKEVLNNLRTGKSGLSRDTAEKIHSCAPVYSLSWLLTGEQALLPRTNRLPLFHKLPSQSTMKSLSAAEHIFFPMEMSPEADFVYKPAKIDDEMPPHTVFLLSRPGRHIDYGKTYIIQYNSLVLFRRIMKGEEHDSLYLLPASDRSSAHDLVLRKSEILRFYRVHAVVTRFMNEES